MSISITFGDTEFLEGQTYQGSNGKEYIYKNGCMVKAAAVTVDDDRYSEQGVSNGTTIVDGLGVAIPFGAPVINFYDADGNYLNSKDCTELNDFAVFTTATTAGVDSAGNAYGPNDGLIELPSGEIFCQEKTPPTDLIIAGFNGIDDAGNTYLAGDSLIQLTNGDIVCAEKTIDTDTVDGYSVQGVSNGLNLDLAGNPIPLGAEIITFYDESGAVINSKDCTDVDTDTFAITSTANSGGIDTAGNDYVAGDILIQLTDGSVFAQGHNTMVDTDTFTVLILAGADGIDASGNAYVAGDSLFQLPSGELVCASKTIDTDTVDGYSLQGFSDGTDLDAAGNPIDAGSPIISFFDAAGDLINSKDCTDLDTDTFGVLATANAGGVDSAGNSYAAGEPLIQLADGSVICAKKTVDTNTDTDTFSTLIIAGNDGTDDAGNAYATGDSLIQLASGEIVCVEKVINTDTVDGYSTQGISDGTQLDAAGNPIASGSEIITFYDSTGAAVNSKDCTDLDTDTFSILSAATANGIDDAGNAYTTGDQLLQLASGELICVEKAVTGVDTFSTLIVAGSDGTDDAGNAYLIGDQLIQLVGGQIVCAEKTIDTDTVDGYSVQGVSDGSQLDANGDPIPTGAQIITFYDASGLAIDSKDCTDADTFAVTVTAAADGVDIAGNAYANGDSLIQLANGDLICAEKPIDTDTVDGYSIQGVSDGTALDKNGDAIPDGNDVIFFYDAAGTLISAKDCTDKFSLLTTATADGTDSAGNAYLTGDSLVQLASGETVCAKKALSVDTFAELIVAASGGTDDAGNTYLAGDSLIQLPNGDLVCAEKKLEWSDNIILATGDPAPTTPSVAGTCSKVVSSDGAFLGTVDDSGYYPVVHPTYKDWAGNDIDPATSKLVNNRNAVDQIRCRDNAIRHRFCDNSFVWTNSQVRRSSTGFSFTEYTNADLQDAIDNNNGLLQEVCAGPLDVPFCGGFVSLFGNLAFETNAPDGTLLFELEKSVDGGATWTSFTSNGAQVVRPRESSGFGSEIVFPHKDIENVIPFASNQITPCYRLYIRTIGAPMSSGVIRVTASGMCAYINNEVCCDADGNPV